MDQTKCTESDVRAAVVALVLVLWGAVVACLVACEDSFTGNRAGSVSVMATTTAIHVRNETQVPIGIFVWAPWMPCAASWGAGCRDENVVVAGGEMGVPYSSIWGYYPGCELVVSWWLCPYRRHDPVQDVYVSTP